jgi:hypothetical protein
LRAIRSAAAACRGFGVERAFDTDPYLVTFRSRSSRPARKPGTVEVYSNGTLIGRRELAAARSRSNNSACNRAATTCA